MNLYTKLLKIDRHVRILSGWSSYLHSQWEEAFASHLSEAEKKDIYLKDVGYFTGYLWHIFSFQKRDHLSGQEAIQAFDSQAKTRCFVFYQHSKDAYLIENASGLHVNDLKDEEDIYIVDTDFTWTFVITHETDSCGPYFAKV